MKKLSIIGLFILALINLNSCEAEDDVVFVSNGGSELSFANSFQSNYVLTSATSGNLAERFTWNSIDTGVPTNVTYSLEKANSIDFNAPELIGSTPNNEIAITVGDLLSYAGQAGIDNDPDTDEPNTGTIYFRLKAVVGTSGNPVFSSVQPLSVEIPLANVMEEAVCEVDILYAVGAGLPTAGWDWATPVEFVCSANGVFSGNVFFKNLI